MPVAMEAASISAPRPPRPTAAGRILEYANEMFPPAILVPYGIASFYAIHFSLQAIAAAGPLRVTLRSAAGALTLVLFFFLMRIYDELKDVENDVRLGKAGDPRYKDRPIVTGRVTVEDVRLLRNFVIAALLALNAPLGLPLPLAAFAGVLGVAWLSSRWFFYPAISQSLLFALVTHNPVALLFQAYAVAVFAAEHGAAAVGPAAALVLLGFFAPVTAWETSRKIRIPEDETAYQTYSKVFGRAAPLVPAAFIALSAAVLVAVARLAGLGWIFPGVLAGVAAIVVLRCAQAFFAPTRERVRLQPFAELYGFVANVGFAIALAFSRGLSFA
jgi:4-hydroxybenzoate polyprenyltransferase